MSYDVDLVIDTGRTYTDQEGNVRVAPTSVWDGNITYNLGAMLRAVGVHLPTMHGWSALSAVPILTDALRDLTEQPHKFKYLEPENGWGDIDWCREFLKSFLEACAQHPKTHINVT